MSEIACTMAMVSIIGALFVGFVSDTIVSKSESYKEDKRVTNSLKMLTETFDDDFEKDLNFKIEANRKK